MWIKCQSASKALNIIITVCDTRSAYLVSMCVYLYVSETEKLPESFSILLGIKERPGKIEKYQLKRHKRIKRAKCYGSVLAYPCGSMYKIRFPDNMLFDWHQRYLHRCNLYKSVRSDNMCHNCVMMIRLMLFTYYGTFRCFRF